MVLMLAWVTWGSVAPGVQPGVGQCRVGAGAGGTRPGGGGPAAGGGARGGGPAPGAGGGGEREGGGEGDGAGHAGGQAWSMMLER